MNRKFCDKCGAEIEHSGVEIIFNVVDIGPSKTTLRLKTEGAPQTYGLDLCATCIGNALAAHVATLGRLAKARKK
jgi:hypothetical protein